MQLGKKREEDGRGVRNSYLGKQIRGAEDEKAQIPGRASLLRPGIQWVPGHRPAAGAALTGCGRTQREAAGAVTAGVVVTHPAKKIRVTIGMREWWWVGRGGEKKTQRDNA